VIEIAPAQAVGIAECDQRENRVLALPSVQVTRYGRDIPVSEFLFLEQFGWEACAERCLSSYSELADSRAR
jgi:hypothetical protein